MEAGFRQYEIAERVGRSQSYVSCRSRLAKPDPAPEVAPEPVAEVPAEPVAEPAPPVEEAAPPEHDSMASPTLGRTLFNYVLSHASADVALCVAQTSNEAVAEKAAAAKGSKAKKSDNVESYVYRDDKGGLALPGEYLRQAVIHAAKFRQDPRSPRKSAMDLFKAGVVSLTEMAPLGVKTWDFLDRRRVLIQRNAVTRERPGLKAGWKATIDMVVLTPEYIGIDTLADVITNAGRLVGVGDFRPTFGRFRIVSIKQV